MSSEQNTEECLPPYGYEHLDLNQYVAIRRYEDTKIRRRLLATFSRGLVCHPEKIRRHAKLDNALALQFTNKLICIAFSPNAGQPVRRLKTQTPLWPSEQNFKSTSTACVSEGGYSVQAALRTGDICQTNHLHSLMPNKTPMHTI
jgi:hypothetical protein